MSFTLWGIVATLVSLGAFLLRRSITKADNPDEIAKRRREEIARNLIKRDSIADAVRVNDLVHALRNRREQSRADHAEGGPKADGSA